MTEHMHDELRRSHISIGRHWSKTVALGIAIGWDSDATACVIFMFGPWCLIVGPHVPRKAK